MRSRNVIPLAVMLLLGLLFCAGNMWETASRSMIPLAVDGVLEMKERRREKHPGVDDVFLLHLAGHRAIEVDQHVFDNVQLGQHLEKAAWSGELRRGGKVLTLQWSRDCRGMAWAMPVAFIVLGMMTVVIARTRSDPGHV